MSFKGIREVNMTLNALCTVSIRNYGPRGDLKEEGGKKRAGSLQ